MQLHISIDNQSTSSELSALAVFAETLADSRAQATDTVPGIPTPATEPKNAPVRRGRGKRVTETEAAEQPTTEAAQQPTTEVAEQPTTEVAEQPTTEVATGKSYTEADVQALATLVARAKGPDAVKEKIAELGGARIADLDADKLNQLGAFLEEQK